MKSYRERDRGSSGGSYGEHCLSSSLLLSTSAAMTRMRSICVWLVRRNEVQSAEYFVCTISTSFMSSLPFVVYYNYLSRNLNSISIKVCAIDKGSAMLDYVTATLLQPRLASQNHFIWRNVPLSTSESALNTNKFVHKALPIWGRVLNMLCQIMILMRCFVDNLCMINYVTQFLKSVAGYL